MRGFRVLFSHLLLVSILASNFFCFATGDEELSISLEDCRSHGFDPLQLSCSTCDILPKSFQAKCSSCCLPFKTLEKRTHRYEGVVLTHPKEMPQMYPEVDTVIKEDMDTILEKKKSSRLLVKDISRSHQPSAIYWLDEIPASSMSMSYIHGQAKEIISLDGWKRDDIRDMLLSLLSDD